jgi:hypothetical protein
MEEILDIPDEGVLGDAGHAVPLKGDVKGVRVGGEAEDEHGCDSQEMARAPFLRAGAFMVRADARALPLSLPHEPEFHLL